MEGVLVGGTGGGDLANLVFSSSIIEVVDGTRKAETEEEVLAVDEVRVRPDRRGGGGGGGSATKVVSYWGCGLAFARSTSDIRFDRPGGPINDFGRS